MSYKVTAALVIIPNADKVSGDGYFYQDSVIPDGWNDERCKQLAKEGMLEKVAAAKPDPAAKEGDGPKAGSVEFILAEVGDDKEKAAAALEQEKAGKNRKTLVEPLEKVLSA